MVVVKIELWPAGRREQARVLSVAAIDCIGEAKADDRAAGVRKGERMYRARLFKDVAFGGPDGSTDLHEAPVWRQGYVRGHIPGRRGGWDLLGGVLRWVLGDRLDDYIRIEGRQAPEGRS